MTLQERLNVAFNEQNSSLVKTALEEMLTIGDDTRSTDDDIKSLWIAAQFGFKDIVVKLLEKPAVIQKMKSDNLLAVRLAAQQGNIEILNVFLTIPEVINNITINENGILWAAMAEGHLSTTRALLAQPNILQERDTLTAFLAKIIKQKLKAESILQDFLTKLPGQNIIAIERLISLYKKTKARLPHGDRLATDYAHKIATITNLIEFHHKATAYTLIAFELIKTLWPEGNNQVPNEWKYWGQEISEEVMGQKVDIALQYKRLYCEVPKVNFLPSEIWKIIGEFSGVCKSTAKPVGKFPLYLFNHNYSNIIEDAITVVDKIHAKRTEGKTKYSLGF